MGLNYIIAKQDDDTNITLYHQGETYQVHSSHPNFEEIRAGLEKEIEVDEEFLDLFSPEAQLARRFSSLTERVSVANGKVYLDHDEVNNSLTDHMLKALGQGYDVQAHANFLEKLEQNPNEHSRQELWNWIHNNHFSLTPDGDIVAYKGVKADSKSVRDGGAIVNGEMVEGRVPNAPGDVIEMPRSVVKWDPNSPCSVGLHAARYSFARSFPGSGGITYLILVNPRDVISVPRYSSDKMRVCRYRVIEKVDHEYEDAIYLELEDAEDESSVWDENDRPNDRADLNRCPECDGNENTCICDSSLEPKQSDVRHPTQEEWRAILREAKTKKKAIAKVAKSKGWEFVGTDSDTHASTNWIREPSKRKPRLDEYNYLKSLARNKKIGFAKLAQAKGWKLVGDNPHSPGAWEVTE